MPFDLDERFVQTAEQAVGVSFPTSYRLAMVRSTGGVVATESDDWTTPTESGSSAPSTASPLKQSVRELGVVFHQPRWRWAATAKVTNSSFSRMGEGLIRRSSSGVMRRKS
jgi:hypothetical protein